MVLTVVALVYLGLFFYVLQATIITTPYWDMFSVVTRYLQYQREGDVLAYLWEPHVQHRHLWIRLLTWFDARAFAGSGYPFVVSATVCLLIAAWCVWRLVARSLPRPHARWVGTISAMLILTSVAAVDCAIPINGIYPQALMFAVASVVLFDGDISRVGSGSSRRTAGLLAAMAAAFGNAAALALWPILCWLAWRSGAGRRWMIVTGAVGAVFIGLYIYRLPGAAVGQGAALDWGRAVTYLITYMGLPWTRSAAVETLGQTLGAVLFLVGTGTSLWLGVVHAPRSRVERVAIAFVAFTLATALLAAAGRSDVDADLRVPVRYSVFVAPLHVGLLLLAWTRGVHLLADRGRQAWLYPALVAVALVLTAQQWVAGRAAVATTSAMRATIARFAAGEETADMTTVIYVDLTQARRDWNAIRAAGLYLDAR